MSQVPAELAQPGSGGDVYQFEEEPMEDRQGSLPRRHERRSHHHHQHHGSSRRGARRGQMLDFTMAMNNFTTMFPTLDADVIEMVLRANDGVVDPTIDQLIRMTATDASAADESHASPGGLIGGDDREDFAHLSSPTIPAEPVSHPPQPEPAPPVLPPKKKLHRLRAPIDQSRTSTSGLRAPLVGSLPDDFLRITPDAQPAVSSLIEETRAAVAASNSRSMVSSSTRSAPTGVRDGQTEDGIPLKFLTSTSAAQLAEDERMALYFQNEEFMRELRRNRDFIQELEKGGCACGCLYCMCTHAWCRITPYVIRASEHGVFAALYSFPAQHESRYFRHGNVITESMPCHTIAQFAIASEYAA